MAVLVGRNQSLSPQAIIWTLPLILYRFFSYLLTQALAGIFQFIYFFALRAIYHLNARIARILLIKILIFDTEDYSDKYSYYELQWELY